MKNKEKQLKTGSLLALMLFGVFGACVLLVLLLGADIYQNISERDRRVYENRTAVQYLTTKVRQADFADGIAVADFDRRDALVLRETIDGTEYETKLYCHEGWLMELYAASDSGLFPADGERILELKELEVSLADGFLQAELTMPDGEVQQLSLMLRSEGRDLP